MSAPAASAAPALPVELTSFVGRERELAEILTLLASSRLLTLTGPGGSGKSRLAREVVERAAAELGAEVAWAELAALEDPSHVQRQVAEACGIAEEIGGGDPAALVRLLRERPLLLVLDNCEHLVEACAELADSLLRGCPGLRVLATSREALGILGERAWLVPALSLPPQGAGTPGEVSASEAVRLFVERARDVHAAFELTDENAAAVADICRRLDGIPLAIELAAARVKVLPPAQIRARLDDAFRLLTTGKRTAIARHRTLRAAIDWSHDLLSEEARALLRRLSVFRGGFTLDAVEAVGRGDDDQDDVLDVLSQLVDRSLVAVREQVCDARYVLLETVRQYAGQRLAESGEEREARSRHAQWIASAVASAEPHFIRSERRVWVDRLLAELDNVREALAWSRTEDPALHVRLVGMLWWFWYSTRHWTEARGWLEGALALKEAAPATHERASLLFAAGALSALQARIKDARPPLEEAHALARESGDARLEAYALNYLGMTYAGEGDVRGKEYSERAAAWFEANGDLYGLRLAFLLQGSMAVGAGNLAEAERLNLEGVRVARLFGQDRELAVSLQNLCVAYLQQGDAQRSEPVLREALAASRRDPSYYFIAAQLQYMGETLGHLGEPLRAARMLGASEALREAIGANMFRLDRDRLERVRPLFQQAAGEAAFLEALAEGRKLTPEAAIDEILAAAPVGRGAPAPPSVAASEAAVAAAPALAPLDLRVRLLGPLEIEISGHTPGADVWRYAKPKELLVYLVTHPQGRSRDQVGQALWPDATTAQVKNSFHVTLHHLRNALGHPEWVVREGDRYLLSRALRWDSDAARFEQEARSALRAGDAASGSREQLADAVALYRGDFMEGQSGGRWIDDERDRLRALYVRAVLTLGGILEERGESTEAAELYHSLALREELNEEVHRRLMQAWTSSGERARALRHYEKLVATLRDVLDADPEPESRELYDRIRAAS